jgi:hypothetical protein
MATKGDVLISVRAPVGDLNVAFEPCCLGRGLAGIQSNRGCQSFIIYTMFALKQHLDMLVKELCLDQLTRTIWQTYLCLSPKMK